MSRTLKCQHCRGVIRLYEPMIEVKDGQVHKTSRAAVRGTRGRSVPEAHLPFMVATGVEA